MPNTATVQKPTQQTQDNWLKDYIGFLEEYAAEQKKKGKKKHELKNGERILAQSGTSLYRFKKRFLLNDSEQFTFILRGEEIDADVVSNEDTHITIRLPEDAGQHLDKIILQTDSSGLSLMLKKRLEEVANQEYFFNRDLVDRLLDGGVPQAIESFLSVFRHQIPSLTSNTKQFNAPRNRMCCFCGGHRALAKRRHWHLLCSVITRQDAEYY